MLYVVCNKMQFNDLIGAIALVTTESSGNVADALTIQKHLKANNGYNFKSNVTLKDACRLLASITKQEVMFMHVDFDTGLVHSNTIYKPETLWNEGLLEPEKVEEEKTGREPGCAAEIFFLTYFFFSILSYAIPILFFILFFVWLWGMIFG